MPLHLAIPRRTPCWCAMRPTHPILFPIHQAATQPIAAGEGITSTVASPVGMQPTTYRLADNRFLLNGFAVRRQHGCQHQHIAAAVCHRGADGVAPWGGRTVQPRAANTFDTNHHQDRRLSDGCQADQLPTAKAGVDAIDDRWGRVPYAHCLLVRSPDPTPTPAMLQYPYRSKFTLRRRPMTTACAERLSVP